MGRSFMPRSKRDPARRPSPEIVLVLQGGGALGAYQGGVYETLVAHEHMPAWVAGTSIGAINGAIVAGNPPHRRLERLREFWHLVGRDDPLAPLAANPLGAWLQRWFDPVIWDTLMRGIPGFFEPRLNALPDIRRVVPTRETSFYDTGPLRRTLEQLVDFDYLNAKHVRLTVCAVDVDTGEQVRFDSHTQRLAPEHIMASGALPPGFPPVVIGGKAYWDGGIYSNTPVDVVMDDAERRDMLCFMVDLWDPTEESPRSISEALMRQKDIQYASRTREHLDDHRTMQNLRRAVDLLAQRLPPQERDHALVRRLTGLGCARSVDIVRLIMKAAPTDDFNKDINFTRAKIAERWQAGARDAGRAFRHKSWLTPVPADVGMVIHELPQEEKA